MDADKRRRQYYALKNVLSKTEKDLIAFYELQWFLRHSVPTIEEVTQHLKKDHPQIKQTSVNFYLQHPSVVKALNKRGIPWRQHSQEDLTATQVAAAVTMMNFSDTRSNSEKLDQLGINSATYNAWLNDPQFKNLIDNLADQNLANIRPTAITEFTKKINQGDWNAIRFWLETTGEMQGNNQTQSEQLLIAIIEIIQTHVKDEAVMFAIARDIQKAAGNRTLEAVNPTQITGEVVIDEELEAARRKLGV